MSVHKLERQLRRYQQMQSRGAVSNWRYKGLLLAYFNKPSDVARAWPTNDRYLQSDAREHHIVGMNREVTPGRAGPDTNERALARSEFGKGKLDQPINRDLYIKRMLLSDSPTELDTLFREELLDTVIAGAEPYQVARDAATVVPVDTIKGDLPRGSAQVYAPSVAEGAEIEMDPEDYDTVAYTCLKYAQGFAITDELLDQANPDVLERQVRFAGAACENAVNRVWLNTIVDSAGQEHDTTGTAQDLTMVNKAIELVEKQDFGMPDTLVMHPEFKTQLFEDSNLAYANQANSDSVLRNRTFNQIMGTVNYTASDGTHNGTQTWGFASDGEIGASLYNSEFVMIPMYQDLTTKDFDDPVRDLRGGNARLYADCVLGQSNAVARIEY